MHAHAGFPHQRKDRRKRDRFRGNGDRGQAEPRGNFAVVCDTATPEMRILRAQPHAMPERRRVLHRPEQHLRILERRVGVRERDTSGFGQLAHLRERLAFETERQRANRIHVGLIDDARDA